MIGVKCRIILSSYDKVQIKGFLVGFYGGLSEELGLSRKVCKFVWLPFSVKRLTVLRSPHGDKTSREVFERRGYRVYIVGVFPRSCWVDFKIFLFELSVRFPGVGLMLEFDINYSVA